MALRLVETTGPAAIAAIDRESRVHLIAYRWTSPAANLAVTGCTCGAWAAAGTVNGADIGHDRHILTMLRARLEPVTNPSPTPPAT